MQSCDSQSLAEAPSLSKLTTTGLKAVPPGALAVYLQAQQAWRRVHVSSKAVEQSCRKMKSASQLRTVVSDINRPSCITSRDAFGTNSLGGLPIFGCKAVARVFEQRHQLLTRHRHQTQARNQFGVKTCPSDTAASLLSLPEDVLVRVHLTNCQTLSMMLG